MWIVEERGFAKETLPLRVSVSLALGSYLGLNDGKTKVDCFGTLTCWGGSGLSGQHQKPFCLAESAPALSIFTGGLKVTFRHNSISRSSLHFLAWQYYAFCISSSEKDPQCKWYDQEGGLCTTILIDVHKSSKSWKVDLFGNYSVAVVV